MCDEKIDPIMKKIKKLVDDLAAAIGPDCEIVLHDVRHPENSIIAIAGNVTGRKIGAPLTDLALRRIRQGKTDENILNYKNFTQDGKLLRSSTFFIRNLDNELVGCLCINFDLSRWLIVKNIVEEKLIFSDDDKEEKEMFSENLADMLKETVHRAINLIGLPVSKMQKDERKKVISILDNEGLFLVKGSIEYVAKELNISKFTIYSYLNEIHSEENFQEVSK